MEKRHNYVRKVAETAVQMYITNDRPNVAGLVLAGSADFKTELSQSDMFDAVCVSYVILQILSFETVELLCWWNFTFALVLWNFYSVYFEHFEKDLKLTSDNICFF